MEKSADFLATSGNNAADARGGIQLSVTLTEVSRPKAKRRKREK